MTLLVFLHQQVLLRRCDWAMKVWLDQNQLGGCRWRRSGRELPCNVILLLRNPRLSRTLSVTLQGRHLLGRPDFELTVRGWVLQLRISKVGNREEIGLVATIIIISLLRSSSQRNAPFILFAHSHLWWRSPEICELHFVYQLSFSSHHLPRLPFILPSFKPASLYWMRERVQPTLSATCPPLPNSGIELFKSSTLSCLLTAWYPSIAPATTAPDTIAVAANWACVELVARENQDAILGCGSGGGDGVRDLGW